MLSFKSLLVANRGEIALRVMRTAKRMGLRTVAVYSDADRDAPHVRAADEAVHIGGSAPKDSYLNIGAILEAARKSGAESIHPGYGFLSENDFFSQEIEKTKIAWVGPPSSAIRAMGDKANAKAIAAKAGVPVLPTYDRDPEFPVMIKALAARDAQLPFHEIEPGEQLGHRVLDLQPRVHFHEPEAAVVAQQEFDRAGAGIAHGPGRGDRRRAHRGTQLRVHRGRGRLLDELLVAALHRAIALAKVDAVAVRVGKDLHFDVPRREQRLFEEDPGVP